MSRAEDLVDLIETTNEIFLINPRRNIRSAYIQIDDLCELIMKSHLQETIAHWTVISHNHNGRDYFKGFRAITGEVRSLFPQANAQHVLVDNLLTRVEARRDNRNHFFHDHHQTGLTVNEEQCLRAFCDLYELMDVLYLNWNVLFSKPLLNAQISVIKLKLECTRDVAKDRRYAETLRRWRVEDRSNLRVALGAVAITYTEAHFEYMVIRFDPVKFLSELTTRGLI